MQKFYQVFLYQLDKFSDLFIEKKRKGILN